MTIPMLLVAAFALAGGQEVRPDSTELLAGTLIVLDKSEATLELIDAETGERFHAAPTGVGPHEVAVSPDGKLAVVCDYGDATPGRTLTVFDLDAREVRRTIDLGEYRRPHGIEFEDAKHVIVTVEAQKAIVRVDVEEGKVTDAFDTGEDVSHMVVLDPELRRAFVANMGPGSVSVIDLQRGELLKTIPTGAGAEGIALTPPRLAGPARAAGDPPAGADGSDRPGGSDRKELWVTNRAADTLTIIDARSLEVLDELPCASFPIRIEITPSGKHALVSNASSAEVVVFDVAERTELRRIPMKIEAVSTEDRMFSQFGQSPVPIGIEIDPTGTRAWIANTNADLVTEIDLATWTVTRRLATGHQPDGMAWVPRRLHDPARDE